MGANPLSFWDKIKLEVQDRVLQPRLGDISSRVSEAYRRRYFRHVFEKTRVAKAHIDGEAVVVRDLSYGGMRVERPQRLDVESWYRGGGLLKVTLDICGEVQETAMRISSIGSGTVGLSCDPLSPFSQLFLNRYLSFMDLGLGLKSIPKSRVQGAYKGPDWVSYGNERGNVMVHLQVDESQAFQEAHVYYVNAARYEYVHFCKGKLAVSCMPLENLSQHQKEVILAQALCLLLGMRQISRSTRLDTYISMASSRLV